tara:strand:+ start:69589 stop:71487 length:1899 start_codon:yes stop_codon:yes gene_type:complete
MFPKVVSQPILSEILSYREAQCKLNNRFIAFNVWLFPLYKVNLSVSLGLMKQISVLILICISVLVTSCQTNPEISKSEITKLDNKKLSLPFEKKISRVNELNEELVFNYLAGEIGYRSGDLDFALKYFLQAAILARDPYAAERATRIALHLKNYEQGLRAVRRWIELDPNSQTARLFGGVLFLRQENLSQSLVEFKASIKIADVTNSNGLLRVATALNLESNKPLALRAMRLLVNDYKDRSSAYYGLALIEIGQNYFPQAIESLKKSVQLKPAWPLPRIALGQILVAQGMNRQGLEFMNSSVLKYPDNRNLRLSFARLLIDQDKPILALNQFKELKNRFPTDKEITYSYAILATRQLDWKVAKAEWEILRNDPSLKLRDEATYFLGYVEEMRLNHDLAIGLFLSVGNGSEFKIDAVIRATHLIAKRGDLRHARELYTESRISHPDRAEDLYISETQMLQDQVTDNQLILDLYSTALSAYPDSDGLLYNRGLFYADIENFEAMETDLQRLILRNQNHAQALNALGYTLADLGIRLDEALAYIMRAYKLKPNNPAILDSLGWAYYKRGEFTIALRYLREAFSVSKDDEISAHLGEVLWMSGEYEEAQSIWRSSLELKPDSVHIKSVIERFLNDE